MVAEARKRKPRLSILGIRGLPASHGGFETFAEKLSLYLIDQGWEVTVYCQVDSASLCEEEVWRGVRLVRINARGDGSLASVYFDFCSVIHSLTESGLVLTLGYNTAIFNLAYRIKGMVSIINMDGVEWRRDKWGILAKAWFWLNERAACLLGNRLIADNPGIQRHLERHTSASKISMIPYGANAILSASELPLQKLGLEANGYALVIARPEPENSILEIVEAFCSQDRDIKLVILGDYDCARGAFQAQVLRAANQNVVFPGAIYEEETVASLRFHAKLYLHGHKVGGTNPSLVEAMGAGNAILAFDNEFNRWVAKDSAFYFSDKSSLECLLSETLNSQNALDELRARSRDRYWEEFRWEQVLERYTELLATS